MEFVWLSVAAVLGAVTVAAVVSKSGREILISARLVVVAAGVLMCASCVAAGGLLVGAQSRGGAEVQLRYRPPVGKSDTPDLISRTKLLARTEAVALFLVMVSGMLAKTLWDAIEARRSASKRFKVDPWAAVRPLLVSPIVFAAVWGAHDGKGVDLLIVCFAFQNGFTWQTLLGARAKASTSIA